MPLITWNDVSASAEAVGRLTDSRLAGFAKDFAKAGDILLKLQYLKGHTVDPNSEEGIFQYFCSGHYLQAPYTFAAAYNLYGLGYYMETIILIRNLVEVLVQMRYFYRHKDKIDGHKQGVKKIKFSVMFDDIAPGFYKRWYGDQLSAVAHGGPIKNLFRYQRKDGHIQTQVVMGCQYDELFAGVFTNYSTALFYAYLNQYFQFNPSAAADAGRYPEIFQGFGEILGTLKNTIDAHKRQFPDSDEWYQGLDPLIGFPTEKS